MGVNKYENFDIEVVSRSQIHEAEYNPRKITDSAFKKLKKWFSAEGKGQLSPITVNKKTMNVVSGHQRLRVLDTLNRGKEYKLTVAMVELDEKTEVEANVFMNNASAQGEFDYDLLGDLHNMFPDICITTRNFWRVVNRKTRQGDVIMVNANTVVNTYEDFRKIVYEYVKLNNPYLKDEEEIKNFVGEEGEVIIRATYNQNKEQYKKGQYVHNDASACAMNVE